MNYLSKNQLQDFEFHDAVFSQISFINTCLTMEVKYLNIHSNAKQNPFDTDMEIEKAILSFEGFKVKSYQSGTAWKENEQGELSPTPVTWFNEDASQHFIKQLSSEITVLDLGILENHIYYMDAIGKEPFFTLLFSFDEVTISWQSYETKAWYVK